MSTSTATSVALAQLLWTAVVPIAIAVFGTLLTARLKPTRTGQGLFAVTASLAVLVSTVAIGGASFPPAEALHWLPVVVVAALVTDLFPAQLASFLRVVVVGAATALLLKTQWDTNATNVSIAVVVTTGIAAVLQTLWGHGRTLRGGGWVFFSLGAALFGLALVLVLSGSARLGQVSGVASLVALTFTALQRRHNLRHGHASALVLVMVLIALGVQGWFYVETPVLGILTPFGALGVPLLMRLRAVQTMTSARATALGVVVATLFVGVGVGAAIAAQPEPDPYYGGY